MAMHGTGSARDESSARAPSVELELSVPGDPTRLTFALCDWTNWPRTFPETITAVQPIEVSTNAMRIEVSHRSHGSVMNELTIEGQGVIRLYECKPLYDAEFRFEPIGGFNAGLKVRARIWLKRGVRLLAFVAPPIVRSRMKKYLLKPLRQRAAELQNS